MLIPSTWKSRRMDPWRCTCIPHDISSSLLLFLISRVNVFTVLHFSLQLKLGWVETSNADESKCNWRRRHYASVRVAKTELGYRRVTALCKPENIAFYQSCGFAYDPAFHRAKVGQPSFRHRQPA